MIVAVLLIGVLVGLGLPLLRPSAAGPRIALQSPFPVSDRGSCDNLFFPGPPSYIGYTFILRNTGDARGIGLVEILVDEEVAAWERYLVQAHDSVVETLMATLNDCGGTHFVSIRLATVTAA